MGTTCPTYCRSTQRSTGPIHPEALLDVTLGRTTRENLTPGAYTGPVPIVTHVHGAVGVGDESDGYPEAWYLPAANDIPGGYATQGTWYDFFGVKGTRAFWG